MLRILCKSKIRKALITGKVLRYEGSIGIDKDIIDAADILPGEQVHVLNLNNGERFITYAIEEQSGSGKVILYGPATRKGEVGDELIILSYCVAENKESRNLKMNTIVLEEGNKLESK
ncbi:MAG: aspartate 1-decarboxylase [Candidatus Omnitrophota bacterium]|jgi:aspartate 1-decarboxylase